MGPVGSVDVSGTPGGPLILKQPVRRLALGALLLAAGLLQAPPLLAQQTSLSEFDRAVFFFGGRFHSDWFGTGLKPWEVNWEDNFILGGGYQQTVLDWNDVRIGGEFGLAGRLGTSLSGEVWAGGFIRYDGLVIADTLRISPAFSAGLSIVTAPIGIERVRAGWIGLTEVPVLVYLGPELNLSLVDQPEWEVFWRLQHRSGGYGWIANIDGANAVTAGFRYKF